MARKVSSGVREREIRKALSAQSVDGLTELILGWSKTNRELRQHLKLWMLERTAPGDRQLEEYRTTLAGIFHSAERCGPYGAPTAAHGFDGFIKSLERLFSQGQLPAVITLAEEARVGLDRLLLELHWEACTEARPNPIDLAERLFRMEMQGEFDVFHEAAFRYRDVLGESGIARFRALAEAEWAKVPVRTPKDKYESGTKFYRISSVMNALASAAGDVDEQVAIRARDLSCSYSFLEIATLLHEAGRTGEAMDWAKKGLASFPGQPDERIQTFLAQRYLEKGDHIEALLSVWQMFQDRPGVESYIDLRRFASKAGAWPEWRRRALELAEQRATGSQDRSSAANTLWVKLLTIENRDEEAWLAAKARGCTPDVWQHLADRMAESRPEEAAAIYFSHAESQLKLPARGKYRSETALILRARQILLNAGMEAQFTEKFQQIVQANRAKKNFLAELNRAQLLLRTKA